MFNSDAKQDRFAANLLNFKKHGTYVDIGSCGSIGSNNSFYFDNILGWKGICIEIEESYKSSYTSRKNCTLLTEDALKVDYLKILNREFSSKTIDYLSLDIDTASLDVLKLLPLGEFNFRVITIEHDSYLYGDTYKIPQRELLCSKGYSLICSDVLVEQSGYEGKNYPFEDWWVLNGEFDDNLLLKISSDREFPSSIINKFNG